MRHGESEGILRDQPARDLELQAVCVDGPIMESWFASPQSSDFLFQYRYALPQSFQLCTQMGELFVLFDEPVVLLGGLADDGEQVIRLPGLFYEFENVSVIDGLDDGLQIRETGEQEANRKRMAMADVPEKFHTRDAGHPLVRHDDMNLVLAHEASAFRGARRFEHRKLMAQEVVDGVADIRLVVHYQQAMLLGWSHRAPFPAGRGRKMRNVAPSPGRLSTSMRPPWPVIMP